VVQALVAAARRLAAGRPEDADVPAVHEAVAYFQRAVPRHFLDEEGSVFPRLSTRRPELAEALAALSAEHPPQIKLQSEIASISRELSSEARPTLGKQLLEAAELLAELHGNHVRREDELFATAQEALTAEDDTEIVAEMEMRRDRDGGGGGGRGRGRGEGRNNGKPAMPVDKPAPKQVAAPRSVKAAKAAKAKKKAAKPKPRAKAKAKRT
jgi:hemerythrin-like domain-containing protein